ncbi:MAG: alpha/beta hydrolase [Kofleriaceae bacterium]|nr:alpha/beta hydrolase [Kofleriaceae bacterium]
MRPWRQSIEAGLVVREYGDPAGAPVVYVHGLGESGRCWLPLLAEPALAGLRHVVVDLPGYGRAAWPGAGEAQGLAEVAAHLARWWGDPRVMVVGHSMGGVIATLWAECAPAALAAVANLDGNLSLGDCTFSGQAAAVPAAQFDEAALAAMRGRVADRAGVGPGADAALRGYAASMAFADPAVLHRHAVDLVTMSTAEDLAARLAALPVPSVYLAGTPGGCCARSRQLLDAAGARWTAIDGSGHWPMIDQPAATAAAVRALAREAGLADR